MASPFTRRLPIPNFHALYCGNFVDRGALKIHFVSI